MNIALSACVSVKQFHLGQTPDKQHAHTGALWLLKCEVHNVTRRQRVKSHSHRSH